MLQEEWLEKIVHGVETHWLSSKKNVSGTTVSKEFILAVFWNMKGHIAIDFFQKSGSVNNTSYCQLLKQNSPLQNDFFIYIYIYIYKLSKLTNYS